MALALSACASLQKDYVRHPSVAMPSMKDTPSTRYVKHEVERHDQQSGFRLLTFSTNALMSRVVLADHAQALDRPAVLTSSRTTRPAAWWRNVCSLRRIAA